MKHLKRLWVLVGIEGRFEYAEDRFKHLTQKLYQSRDMFLQARGACNKEVEGKMPSVKSGSTIHKQARTKQTRRSERSKQGSSQQVDTDKNHSSQDIQIALTDLVSESLVYPQGANQHQFRMDTSTKSGAAYLNSGDVYCEPLRKEPKIEPSTSGLYSDVDNGSHTATHAIKTLPPPVSSTPRAAKKTSTFDHVTGKNHNSVITSSSASSCSFAETETDEVSPPNIVKNGGNKFLANNTDRGAFTAITSRSHADGNTTTEENEERVDSSGQVEKSRHSDRSKTTTLKMAQLSPKSRTIPKSILTKEGNSIVIDTKIENIYVDVTDHDKVEFSSNSHLKANNKNSNECISSMSRIRKVYSHNCEIDSLKKRNKSARNVTLKKSGTLCTQDETRYARNKKSRSTIGVTNKLVKSSSPNDETDVTRKIRIGATDNICKTARMSGRCDKAVSLSNKRSKIYIDKSYKVASTMSQNDGTVVPKKRSKGTFTLNNTSLGATMTIQKDGTVVIKKRSKHYVTNTSKITKMAGQNDETYSIKLGNKCIIGNINVTGISGPNDKRGVIIKRSQSSFANISKVPRMTVQNYSKDMTMKKSKSIVTNTSQTKRKYSSPYAQSNLNKGSFSSYLLKQKSSYHSSGMSGRNQGTIAVYVKPKPPSLCSQLKKPSKGSKDINDGARWKQNLSRQSIQLCHTKKGGKSTIQNTLHLKQKPSNTQPQFNISNNGSRGSIACKFEVKRKHKISQHRLKKLKKINKCLIGEQQSEMEVDILECSRNNKTRNSHNEPVVDKNPDKTMDTLMGMKTQRENFDPGVFHDSDVDATNIFESRNNTLPNNYSASNKHHCLAGKDLQYYQLAETENDTQSLVKSTPLSRSASKQQETGYKHTVFLFNGLQKHYLIPTISSQLKRVMKSPFITSNRRIMPFVVAKSTMPSHNINIQIQDVISIMRKKNFPGDMSTLLKRTHNSTLTLPTMASAPFKVPKSTRGQDSCQALRESMALLAPGRQLSMYPSQSKYRDWKPVKRPHRLADVWTSQRGDDDITITGSNNTCCCSPSRTETNNYQAVLNKYLDSPKAVRKTRRKEQNVEGLTMPMDQEEAKTTETDGMRGRRLLCEILGYIYEDVQQLAQNLKVKSSEMGSEEEMESIRARVERNTAIVDETMKLMKEGKDLQNKYKKLAHAVTQDVMFDSHAASVTPSLRAPPLTSRLRALMLNIKHFKEELIES